MRSNSVHVQSSYKAPGSLWQRLAESFGKDRVERMAVERLWEAFVQTAATSFGRHRSGRVVRRVVKGLAKVSAATNSEGGDRKV